MFLVRLLIGEPSKRQRLIWSSSEKIIETCLRLKIRQCVYRISAKESCKLNSYQCCDLHFFVNKAFAATLLQLRGVFHSCNFPWRKPKDVVPPPVGFLLMKKCHGAQSCARDGRKAAEASREGPRWRAARPIPISEVETMVAKIGVDTTENGPRKGSNPLPFEKPRWRCCLRRKPSAADPQLLKKSSMLVNCALLLIASAGVREPHLSVP